MTPPETKPGRVGNLTPEQEDKLRQLWGRVLQLCENSELESQGPPSEQSPASTPPKPDQSAGEDGKPRKRRISLFTKKSPKGGDGKPAQPRPDSSPGSGSAAGSIQDDPEDKYGQTKQFHDTLATMSPEHLRATTWSMVKHDHPDALCLRFLRARKWDVEKALIMLISTMNWRGVQMHVDDDIMKTGEAAAVADVNSDDAKVKKVASDFVAQLRQGKSFLHGLDKNGSPVCIIRVRLHKVGEQSEEGLERYTVFLIETARMVLRPPIDTATMVFDMTGFSMANMDYTPVKFVIKCFEANYPESLSAVIVHNAPWVFQGIWKMIRGWLDPVVASKITFTNNIHELQEFISPDRVIKELGGTEQWEYKYVEPVAGENDTMKDTATRDRLLAAREQIIGEYERNTVQWIKGGEGGEKDSPIQSQRNELAAQLRENYWKLDPYIRARSIYDRVGILQGEKVDFYPPPPHMAPGPGAAAAPPLTTSESDVD